MLRRVANDLRRRVEAHRLAVEQGGGESGRMPAFDPGRGVDEDREAGGVALREAVGAEALDLLEAAFGEIRVIAVGDHAAAEPLAERTKERRVGTECVSRVDLGCSRIIKKKRQIKDEK